MLPGYIANLQCSMQKLFNNILVPVNTSSPEKRVEKAVELANIYNCNIHLLSISHSSGSNGLAGKIVRMFSLAKKTGEQKTGEHLQTLSKKFQHQLHKGLKIFSHSEQGNKNEVAIDYILSNKIDLVVDTIDPGYFKKKPSGFDVNLIAGKTSAAVITVPEGRLIHRLYSIVIPVTDSIPLKKLMYGIYMARYYNITFHLLGITHEHDSDYNQKVEKYLHRSYRLIRDHCDVPVDMIRRSGTDVIEVAREYSVNNNADLVIVSPDRKKIDWLSDIMQKKIYPPVLTISSI